MNLTTPNAISKTFASSILLLAMMHLMAATCLPSRARAEQKDPIAWVRHEGHFERNDSGLKGAKSFLVVDNLEKFESIFGVAALGLGPTRKQNFVANETFKERIVLAAIYRGNSEPNISDINIRLENETLVIRYKLRPGRDAGFAMNVPLILSIPKQKYQKIEFYENGKLVSTLPEPTTK
jgi:hypothetical protein